MKKAKMGILSLILMFVVVSAVASASDMWPGWFKSDGPTAVRRAIQGAALSSPSPSRRPLFFSVRDWFPLRFMPRGNAPRSSNPEIQQALRLGISTPHLWMGRFCFWE